METRQSEVISYIAHEGEMARMERVNNRLWVVIIILIVALLATNGAWIWYESQWEVYEEVTQEVTQDAPESMKYDIQKLISKAENM